MKKTNSDSNSQGGCGSTKNDSLISVKEMCSYDNVVLYDLCDTDDKTDSLVPSIGIKKSVVLTGEMVQIPIKNIKISEIHSKIYESEKKRDKINELKDSIKLIGQLQPIIIALFNGQNYLLDGRLRLIAMLELGFDFISVIISPSVNDGDTLDNLVMQYHIRKELTASEKLKEIKQILRIGEETSGRYIGKDNLRKIVSKKLGKGFQRSSVIDLENIIEFEMQTNFDLGLAEKVVSGQLKVAKGTELVSEINSNNYTPEMEKESKVVSQYLDGTYDFNETKKLIKSKIEKADGDKEEKPEYLIKTNRYEIRQGSIFNVDLSDVTFDVIFSSPPYALQREYGDNKTEEVGVEKNVDDYIQNIVDAFEIGYTQLSEKGSLFVNINDTWRDGFSLNVIEKFIVEMGNRGIRKVQVIAWEKKTAKPSPNTVKRLINKFEYVIHFSKSYDYEWHPVGKPKSNLKAHRNCKEVGVKNVRYSLPNKISILGNMLNENVLEGVEDFMHFGNIIKTNPNLLKRQFEEGEDQHTATFNMLLPLIPILLTCPRDRQAVIGDLFAGTSTTGEVALALGHNFVGVELYKSNCETSARVLAEALEDFKDVNLMEELFEIEVEQLIAA
ncbi:MAG: DNA methyltransferase [Paludibacter sp.]